MMFECYVTVKVSVHLEARRSIKLWRLAGAAVNGVSSNQGMVMRQRRLRVQKYRLECIVGQIPHVLIATHGLVKAHRSRKLTEPAIMHVTNMTG